MSTDPAAPPRAHEPGAYLAALLAFLLTLPIAFVGQAFMDETTLLSHAKRIAGGQVIYRDFFEFIAPFAAWLPAWLGLPSLLSLRVVTGAALALAAWQLYQLARRLDVPGWVAPLPGLVLAVLYASAPGYSHHWLIQPMIFGAVLALGPTARSWLLAGVAAGLACLTVQSDGVVLAAVLGAWWLWADRRPATAAALAAGLALPLGAALAYFAAQHALPAVVADMGRWPLEHYKRAGGINDVKYLTDLAPLLSTTTADFRLWKWYVHACYQLYAYLLPLGLGALLLAAAPVVARRKPLALAGLLAFGMFAALVKGRADAIHAACYLPAWLLVATALGWRWQARFPEPGLALVRWLPLASLAAFGLAGALVAGHDLATNPELRPLAGGPDARILQDPAVAYLRAHAAPGDRLAVFPLGAQFYAYGVPPATTYTSMLDPAEGYYSQAEYDDFWRQVRTNRPRYVMLGPLPRRDTAPAAPVEGYHLAAALPLDYMGRPSAAWIFERPAPNPPQ